MFAATSIRTFAILGHRGSGKTSLGDWLLATSGVTRQPGSVDEGTSLLDHAPEERRRHMTLGASFAWLDWREHRLFLVDTPGCEGLAHEQRLALSMVDAIVVVVDARAPLPLGTRRLLRETKCPMMVVLSHLDRKPNLDIRLQELQAALGQRLVLVQDFDSDTYSDIWDGGNKVLREKLIEAIAVTDDGLLEIYLEDLDLSNAQARPALADAVRRGALVPIYGFSASAGVGATSILDAIIESFPNPNERKLPLAVDEYGHDVAIDGEMVVQHMATRLDMDGKLYAVFRVWSGQADLRADWQHGETGRTLRLHKLYALRGSRASIAKYVGPGAIVATWESIGSRPGDTWTIGPRRIIGAPAPPAPMLAWTLSSPDRKRLEHALDDILALDSALDRYMDEVTLLPVIAGLGQDQLERAVEWIRGRFGLEVQTALPKVAWKETPIDIIYRVKACHQRNSEGLPSEFGEVVVELHPEQLGEIRIEFMIEQEDLPVQYIDAVRMGIQRALTHGPLGWPVTGILVRCVGGNYDILVSKPEHFVKAAEAAVQQALQQVGTALLEPWSRATVWAPIEDMGQVLSELSGCRGRIVGLDTDQVESVIYVLIPDRELRLLGSKILALTEGLGRFIAYPSHFERAPSHLVREAVVRHS